MARDHVMNNDWSPRASSAARRHVNGKPRRPFRRWNSQPVMMRSVRQVLQCEASYSGICCMIFGFYGLSKAHEQWRNCGYWLEPIWNTLAVACLFVTLFASLLLLLSNQEGWLCSIPCRDRDGPCSTVSEGACSMPSPLNLARPNLTAATLATGMIKDWIGTLLFFSSWAQHGLFVWFVLLMIQLISINYI